MVFAARQSAKWLVNHFNSLQNLHMKPCWIGLSLEDTMDVFLNNIENLEEAYATKFLELNPNEEVRFSIPNH